MPETSVAAGSMARAVATGIPAHAGDVGGSGFDAAGDADVSVEHAVGVVVAIEEHGEGIVDLRGDVGGMAEGGTEFAFERSRGGEGGIDSRQSTAELAAGGVAETGGLRQHAGTDRQS